jgi:hypothetical protein
MKIFATGRLAICAALLGLLVQPASAQEPAAPPRAGNPHGDMKLDCRLCHGAQDGLADNNVPAFDHGTTGFALEGQHALVKCRDCHKQPQFAHIGTRCADCHLDAHKSQLGPACEQCHTPEGWVERTRQQREHDTTRLPLVGAHAKVDCEACHTGAASGEYVGTPHECAGCHLPQFEATVNPPHRSAGFSTECDRCHGVFSANWGSGDFIHSLNFPLTGAHATAACASCHATGFVGTPTDCYACHQADYDGSVNPAHAAANLGNACATCHGTGAWRPSNYDHSTPPASYRLDGGHRGVDCAACHATGYVATPTDCYACHRPDYEGAADPNHVAGGFPTDCATCHAVTAWNESNFDHALTAFPLTGAHATQTCTQCHTSGYAGTPTDCFACHQTDYAATASPDHAAANIPTTCVVCHSTTAWAPAQFDHNTTAFPLTGAHRTATCAGCHAGGYSGTSTDCYACHQTDYAQTSNPGHSAASFPTTCATCHSTTAWMPSSWDHEPLFPIETGAHSNLACAECHVTPSNYAAFECILCHEHNQTDMARDHEGRPNYQWVSTACYACHPQGRS